MHFLGLWLSPVQFLRSRLSLVHFLGSRLSVVQFLGSRLSLVQFLGSRLSLVHFLGSRLSLVQFLGLWPCRRTGDVAGAGRCTGVVACGVLVATVLALSSAGLHATWNLLVKTARVDRDLATWGQFLLGGLLAVPVLFVIGWPPAVAYPYLLASGTVHVAYVTGLVQAYTHGDFSLAYPLARGGGALLAAVGGVLLLGDVIAGRQWIGIVLVAVGLVSLVGRGASAASIGWALFTAATIAVYTIIDSKGARLSDDGLRYGFALMPFAGTMISVAQVARGRAGAFRAALPAQWWRWLLAGAFVTVAYSMVMIAVRQPGVAVGYVTMLRESSVVMGALAGWLLLDERLGRHRLVSSCVIVAGLITLIAFAAR